MSLTRCEQGRTIPVFILENLYCTSAIRAPCLTYLAQGFGRRLIGFKYKHVAKRIRQNYIA